MARIFCGTLLFCLLASSTAISGSEQGPEMSTSWWSNNLLLNSRYRNWRASHLGGPTSPASTHLHDICTKSVPAAAEAAARQFGCAFCPTDETMMVKNDSLVKALADAKKELGAVKAEALADRVHALAAAEAESDKAAAWSWCRCLIMAVLVLVVWVKNNELKTTNDNLTATVADHQEQFVSLVAQMEAE
jgi:hypothetical protein